MGDHYQLPPLVSNPAAEAGGLGRSLFRILCEAHPQVLSRHLAFRKLSHLAISNALNTMLLMLIYYCQVKTSNPVKIGFFNAAQAVVTLRAQYRMSADIMAIPNALVYNGALAAGSPAVASRALCLPHMGDATLSPWLQKVCTYYWGFAYRIDMLTCLSWKSGTRKPNDDAWCIKSCCRWWTLSTVLCSWTLMPAHIWQRQQQQRR